MNSRSGMRFLEIALLFFMLVSTLSSGLAVSSQLAKGGRNSAVSLNLTIIPQRLPADGKTYPAVVVTLRDSSEDPSVALNATTVYLTSSQASVGTVESPIVIPAGFSFVIANFNTTVTPGTTTITASATGLESATANIETNTPSGFASNLKVTPVPGSVFSRPGGTGSLVVQLQDETGLPAKAAFDTNITISSSNNAYVQPDVKSIVVPAGADVAVVNYTVGYTIGSAFVTASASGFNSGTAQVGIVGSPPYYLKVSAQPSNVVTSGSGRVVVWLEDPSGNPARAPSPIPVDVTSSNLTVAEIAPGSQTLVIPAGQTEAIANFTSTVDEGKAIITASAQGLLSGFDNIQTFAPTGVASTLEIYDAPNPVLADSSTYNAIVVSVVNATGAPEKVKSSVLINLTSSATAVGTVSQSISIPAGGEWATASFTSTFLVGSTVLTASAQNLVSDEVSQASYGPIPVSVLVVPSVRSLPADGGTYSGLVVELEDINGNPAVAPSDTVVQVASSRPDVIRVDSPIVLKAGQSYSFVSLTTGLSPGSANVTASASGYAASSALLGTVVPAPTKLAAYIAPSETINSTLAADARLTVQLQDIDGFPAQARQTTNIVVTSSNSSVFKQPMLLSISPGVDYATVPLQTSTFGNTNLTVSSPGLGSSSAALEVLPDPINFTAVSSVLQTSLGTPIGVSIKGMALNAPLAGAKVEWTVKGGTVTPRNSSTGTSGLASTTFIPQTSGMAYVYANVTTPLRRPTNITVEVYVPPPVIKPKPSLAASMGIFLYIIIVVVVVVVLVFAFIFLRRRRKGGGAAEEGAPSEEEKPYDELEEMPEVGEQPGPGGEGEVPPGEAPATGGETTGGESGSPGSEAGSPDGTI